MSSIYLHSKTDIKADKHFFHTSELMTSLTTPIYDFHYNRSLGVKKTLIPKTLFRGLSFRGLRAEV